MACGGCARRAKEAWGGTTKKPRQPLPAEPTLYCPACEIYHTEREWKMCPFRLQKEKQQAREHRQQVVMREKQAQAATQNRRGRNLTPPPAFSQANNKFTNQSKRKW